MKNTLYKKSTDIAEELSQNANILIGKIFKRRNPNAELMKRASDIIYDLNIYISDLERQLRER